MSSRESLSVELYTHVHAYTYRATRASYGVRRNTRTRGRERLETRRDRMKKQRGSKGGVAALRREVQRTKCKPRLHGALNSDRDTCASLGSLSLSSCLSVVASFVHSLYSTVNIVSRSHFMLVCGIAQQLSLVTVGGIFDEGFPRSFVSCHTFEILPFDHAVVPGYHDSGKFSLSATSFFQVCT